VSESAQDEVLSKVPAVTLGFWIIKVLATTLGETGGDAVSMSWLGETTPQAGQSGLNGYLVGTALFGVALLVLVAAQIRARRFRPWLYWATIVASTTMGTTLADFSTRSLGLGYPGGSLLLLACVAASLLAWQRTLGTVSTDSVATAPAELFYWVTIAFSQTLGTALGDWVADSALGYAGSAMLFGGALAVVAVLYRSSAISRVALFWTAFVLTRPLGATVGDFLDKPLAQGGLALSRAGATAALVAAILVLIALVPQRPGRHLARA